MTRYLLPLLVLLVFSITGCPSVGGTPPSDEPAGEEDAAQQDATTIQNLRDLRDLYHQNLAASLSIDLEDVMDLTPETEFPGGLTWNMVETIIQEFNQALAYETSKEGPEEPEGPVLPSGIGEPLE